MSVSRMFSLNLISFNKSALKITAGQRSLTAVKTFVTAEKSVTMTATTQI